MADTFTLMQRSSICSTGTHLCLDLMLCCDVNHMNLGYRGSANGNPVNGWAGQGPTTTNTHQLWHVVRA